MTKMIYAICVCVKLAQDIRYVLRILEKQLNEPDAPSPSTTPRTPPVRRAVHFPGEAPGPYGGPNDC